MITPDLFLIIYGATAVLFSENIGRADTKGRTITTRKPGVTFLRAGVPLWFESA
jgi:hypothetical protein